MLVITSDNSTQGNETALSTSGFLPLSLSNAAGLKLYANIEWSTLAEEALTGNADVSLLLLALRIGEEQDDLSACLGPKNAQVLTDAFFPSSLGFGFSHPGREDDRLNQKSFLKMNTIYSMQRQQSDSRIAGASPDGFCVPSHVSNVYCGCAWNNVDAVWTVCSSKNDTRDG